VRRHGNVTRLGLVFLIGVQLCGCAIRNVGPQISAGASNPQQFPSAQNDLTDYAIGPLDTIDISVFQQPDLSLKAVRVDASGRISLPLIGQVMAAGRTAAELGTELERLYGRDYVVRPQISVNVATTISQKVIVQGQVSAPGVYDLKGPTTLLEVVSLAHGETKVAALDQVVVLRTINGQKMGAVFDVASIRRNEAPDPAILGNDVVIIGFSNARGLWSDILTASPLLNAFVLLGR
jgi:polysaccharide export outer membrane protein